MKAAGDHVLVHQPLALAGRERPDDEDLAAQAALVDGTARADRPLAAEGEEALEVRVRPHEVEGGAAAVVDALGDAEAVGHELHAGVVSPRDRRRPRRPRHCAGAR
jgi:hypothetical protein